MNRLIISDEAESVKTNNKNETHNKQISRFHKCVQQKLREALTFILLKIFPQITELFSSSCA